MVQTNQPTKAAAVNFAYLTVKIFSSIIY